MSKHKKRKLSQEEREEKYSTKRLKKVLKDYKSSWTGIMIFIALGLILTVYAALVIIRSPDYSKYEETWGKIVESKSKASYTEGGRYGGLLTYHINLIIEYSAGEESFTPTFALSSSQDYSKSIYMEGKEIKVYYNPQNPGEAVLNRGSLNLGYLAILGLGLILLIIGTGGALNTTIQTSKLEKAIIEHKEEHKKY